jgi:4-carboxymuconolactone decarboxylase
MLIALGKRNELKVHLVGGQNNGLSVEELREIIIHSAVYAGFPAAFAAMEVLQEVLPE